MRIATYNVEWFSELFDNAGNLMPDEKISGRDDISREDQITALGIVFERLDADMIMVIEAPDQSRKRNTVTALEAFAAHFGLRASKGMIGFANTTQQEIAVLYDPTSLTMRHDPQGDEPGKRDTDIAPRFDGYFKIDLDIDATEDKVSFSKPPLELEVETRGGFRFRMIGAHLKSKAPHGASTPEEAMQISIANRRKQLAQAVWLRRPIEEHLNRADPLIVLGDLNDGPGLDEYEGLFGRSSVEIIMGRGLTDRVLPVEAKLFDPHAAQGLSRKLGAIPTTARFYLEDQDRYLQALLDYIMVSQEFMAKRPSWRIWHPFDTPECLADTTLRTSLLVASDHFPVTLDIEF